MSQERCPAADVLLAAVERRLSSDAHGALIAHVDGCDDCHAALADLVRAARTPDDPGAAAVADTMSASGSPAELALEVGATLNRFVVVGKLGAGAMGAVVAAYDPKLDRKVAIKVVRARASRSQKELQARLLREAQAAARLSHPAVITIYEVGTIDDDVFVVMEYVDGGTLSAWLAAERRSWRQIVELFVRVGSGLAAAHAAGLVHRDFKPDNVLVAGDGRVRVTDFGLVAVAPIEDSPDAPLTLTRTGTVLGTPLFMAPEQHRREVVDGRADQFAFCVALYRALYGAWPFAGERYEQLAAEVLAGRIREPPRDKAVPAWLRRAVVRGLRAAPDDRFASMDDLLAELRGDRRRTRRRLALSGAILAVAGGVALAWPAARPLCRGADRHLVGVWDADVRERARRAFAATALPYAADAWGRVGPRLDGYAASWAAMHVQACEATRIDGEQSEHALDLRMGCLERRRGELRALAALFADADGEVVETAVAATAALAELAGCADLQRLAAVIPPPGDRATLVLVEAARAQLATTDAYRQAGRFAGGLALVEPALAIAERSGYMPVVAEALLAKGRLVAQAADHGRAERLLRAAAVAAEAGHHDEAKADAYLDLSENLGNDQSSYDDALAAADMARAILTRLPDPVRETRLLLVEGFALAGKEDYDAADARYRRALEVAQQIRPPHLHVARSLNGLATIAYNRDRFDESIAYLRRAIAVTESLLGPEHPRMALVLGNLGLVLMEQGQLAAAQEVVTRALAVAEAALPPEHPQVLELISTLGDLQQRRGEPAAALATYRRGLAIVDAKVPDAMVSATMLIGLGGLLEERGDYDEALAAARRALAIRERLFGPDNLEVGRCFQLIGDIQASQGETDGALASYARSLALAEKALGKDSSETGAILDDLGKVWIARGEPARGLERCEQARDVLEGALGPDTQRLVPVHRHLGEALAALGRPAEALAAFERGLRIATATYGADHAEVGQALVGVGTARLALGNRDAGVEALAQGVALLEARAVKPHRLAAARLALAAALWPAPASRARAVALARQARDGFTGTTAFARAERRGAESWLRAHAAR